jgi:YgiT-type zinc finger domain-containing protein
MTCVICKHGTTAPGTATMTFDERETVIVIRNVPAEVCGNCREAYFDRVTTKRLLSLAEEASRAGVKVEIRALCRMHPCPARGVRRAFKRA